MDVATITMPTHKARRAYLEYRDVVKKSARSPSESDVTLMRSYRALSLGRRILNLYDVMRLAGVDERWRPRLAVARADEPQVTFSWIYRTWQDRPAFGKEASIDWECSEGRIVFPANTFPYPSGTSSYSARCDTIVPTIPPRLRPKFQLHNYYLLWEADWNAPPADPILLKRVHGLIFAVLAQWDLTELEQSVLGLVRAQDE